MTDRTRPMIEATGTNEATLGQGDYVFRADPHWAKLPDEIVLGDVAAIAVDRKDRVYLFNRGDDPIVVLDREGNFLKSWGRGVFKNPHGLHIGLDDAIYCTDDGDHTVRKCTLDGKLLLEIGAPGKPAPFMSGQPFCRCCHTALSKDGSIFVADGYGNACIHKYDPNGKHLFSWGEPGIDPGQFNLPHNICCDADGWLYVADRENHRIQVFDQAGKYESQINNLHRPSALTLLGGSAPNLLVGEIGPYMNVNRHTPNLGPRVTIMDHQGKVLSRLGEIPTAGVGHGQFLSPHGIAMDSKGDLYVGEVSSRAWPSLFPDQPLPSPLRRFQKFTRVTPSS